MRTHSSASRMRREKLQWFIFELAAPGSCSYSMKRTLTVSSVIHSRTAPRTAAEIPLPLAAIAFAPTETCLLSEFSLAAVILRQGVGVALIVVAEDLAKPVAHCAQHRASSVLEIQIGPVFSVNSAWPR